MYFQPLRRGHLPIKDKNCWSQGVLYSVWPTPFHTLGLVYYRLQVQRVLHFSASLQQESRRKETLPSLLLTLVNSSLFLLLLHEC